MIPLSIDTKAHLNNSDSMPLLGLGLFENKDPRVCIDSVLTALDCGYRHIDTAEGYQNEAFIGKALRDAKIDRDEIFITTKVMPPPYCELDTRSVVEKSLRELQLEVIDLYLVHWPMREGTEAAYETLLAMQSEGKIKSVGVSNFTRRRFDEQFFKSVDNVPTVNQIERHPFNHQQDTVDYCREKDIQIVAYSPLARARSLGNRDLVAIAASHGKTPAQVVLRWQLQQGVAIIPKSANPKRIAENADLFDFHLDKEAMQLIDKLNRDEFVVDWRPEPDWF